MENETMLFIEGTRSGYSPDQCDNTMTINELIDKLEGLRDYFDGDTKIYLINDNGYTYGHINERTIHTGIYNENSGVEYTD